MLNKNPKISNEQIKNHFVISFMDIKYDKVAFILNDENTY